MTVTPQLKAIIIAGGLAALALVLGFFTLSMNQSSSSAAPAKILPLKERHAAGTAKPAAKPTAKPRPRVKPKPKPNPNVVAALAAGLPKSVAVQLATKRAVVVMLFSSSDEVDDLARAEAASGAALAGAGFVAVDVDADKDSATLTRTLGTLPPAPAALVYTRPATLYVTLPGFNDRTTIQQAAANALTAPAGSTTTPAPAPVAPAPVPAAPATTTTAAPVA
ncbi:MAG TPA: hypothetical protein VGJ77_12185 [Gaiellaceae bacterium]